jgi:hypothetical protein
MKKPLCQFLVLTVSIAAGYLVCLAIKPGARSYIAIKVPPVPTPALVTAAPTAYWVGHLDSSRVRSKGAKTVSLIHDPFTAMLERPNKDLIDLRPTQ